MELNQLIEQNILEYNADTFEVLRRQYDLDKPDRLEDAITILLDWLKKQDHIVKKAYFKEYLERMIINSKGSLERAKMKLEKIATYRTLLPQYFEPLPNIKKTPIMDLLISALLPKLTKDHCRVYMTKSISTKFENGFMEFYRSIVMTCEYLQLFDYSNGAVVVFDYRDSNLFEVVKSMNVLEMHQAMKIIMEGFCMRIKGIHFITTSKAIDTLILLFKQVLSAKVAERIHVHKTEDSLYEYIPREILPRDYGGQAKSIFELADDFKSALASEDFMKYLKEMQHACTNEDMRRNGHFNDEHLGMPGSFRKLTVD